MNGVPNQEALERMKAAREHSLKLIQMESNGSLDKISKQKRDSIDESLNGGIDTHEMVSRARNVQQTMSTQNRRMTKAAEKVPAAIRESFQNFQIDETALATNGGASSVIDDIFGGEVQQQPIQEQVVEQRQYQPSNTGIDYPTIRSIVEDIVRKYTEPLTKTKLNESAQPSELGTLMLGKSFKFLAKNGDIFECTMKKVGNINDKR